MIKIGDQEYQVRILSAGDLPALSSLADKAGPLLADLKPGQTPPMMRLLPLTDELITVGAQLLDCPRKRLEKLPLHEFIELAEQVAAKWFALNATYLAEQVTPALNQLAQGLVAEFAAPPTDPTANSD